MSDSVGGCGGGEGHSSLGAGGEKMTRPSFEGGVRVPWLEGAIEGVVATLAWREKARLPLR